MAEPPRGHAHIAAVTPAGAKGGYAEKVSAAYDKELDKERHTEEILSSAVRHAHRACCARACCADGGASPHCWQHAHLDEHAEPGTVHFEQKGAEGERYDAPSRRGARRAARVGTR